MGAEKDNVFDKSAFIFNSNQADVRVDTITHNPGEEESYILKINSIDSKNIRFAYQYGEGLINLDSGANSKRKSNILGELLRIKREDLAGYISFFENYGFLFPIPSDRFININPYQIMKMVDRLEITLNLMNEINDTKLDIRTLMDWCLYLIFDGGWEYISPEKERILSPEYDLEKFIDEEALNLSEKINKQEEVNKGSYTIGDCLYGRIEFDAREYREIMGNYVDKKGFNDSRFLAITFAYVNRLGRNEEEQYFIDALFNWFYKVGIPDKLSSDGADYYSRCMTERIDGELISAVIEFAKYVVKQEIDARITNIHPVFNNETMKPDWSVDSLLSALYFSLFYLDSKKEMWRRCEHCGTYFLVNRSSSVKKYCSDVCRNNAQQAKHRLKLKQQDK